MNKKVLVTAGNTTVQIDKVRGLTNIFTGKTGAAIAGYFANQGWHVTLLASHPELVKRVSGNPMEIIKFKTYDELFRIMEFQVRHGDFDVIVQSGAISDFSVAGAYQQMGQIREDNGHFYVELEKLDQSGKISSKHPKLWFETSPTVKIVDQIREPWGFRGLLVKFKLQVNMDDATLAELAQKSLAESKADIIVANTLDKFNRAMVIGKDGTTRYISREEIPESIYKGLKL